MMSLTLEAQQFLFSTQKGILSTHSAKFEGYPFGSVTPFVLNHQGLPTILISSIAEHTKNIIQNANVSLVVFTDESDLQANARLTLLAKAEQSDKHDNLMRARYLRYIPQAASYFDTHDFAFYTLYITQARYIAGFGKMGWVEAADLVLPTKPLLVEETDIIAHMNADHQHNLTAYCGHFHQINTAHVEMIGIDTLGFDLRLDDGKVLRFNFDSPINNAQDARQVLVEMAKQCRAE